MIQLFENFPYLQSEMLIIKKMTEEDLNALVEITSNDNIYSQRVLLKNGFIEEDDMIFIFLLSHKFYQ